MVEYITGFMGIGKTRTLVEAATATAEMSKGNVIFIDCSDKMKFVLPSSIRLINIKEYDIGGSIDFYGFLTGLCAADYDLTDIFIDSTLDIFDKGKTNLDDFFEIVSNISRKTEVNFHFSVCDSTKKAIAYSGVDA